MGSERFIGTMNEWMRDIGRRLEVVERRKHHVAKEDGTTTMLLGVGVHTLVMPAGVRVVDSTPGSVTIEVLPPG